MDVRAQFMKIQGDHTASRDGNNNYSSFNVENCRNSNFLYNSRNCISCHKCDSLIDCVQCVDCSHCAFSVGLNGASFHILNEEYPEHEYYRKLKEMGIDPNVEAF
jgi:hypothetical protein